jgi:hypothetical protein
MDFKVLANEIGLKNISLIYRENNTPIIENILKQIDFDIQSFPFEEINDQLNSLDFSIILLTNEENKVFYVYSPDIYPLLRIDFFNSVRMPTMKNILLK